MKIEYSPKFARQFKKLPREAKESAVKCEKLFKANPFDSKLGTHKLHGRMKEYWSFSVSYGCRITFSFVGDGLVRFHSAGSHDIYK